MPPDLSPPEPSFWKNALPFLHTNISQPTQRSTHLEFSEQINTIQEQHNKGKIEFLFTGDGSPSLSHFGEPMHNKASAFQETHYVYGPAIECFLNMGTHASLAVVGFGAGYIEALIAGLSVRKGLSAIPGNLFSFETDKRLYAAFNEALQLLQGPQMAQVLQEPPAAQALQEPPTAQALKTAEPSSAASPLPDNVASLAGSSVTETTGGLPVEAATQEQQLVCMASAILTATANALNVNVSALANLLVQAKAQQKWHQCGAFEEFLRDLDSNAERSGAQGSPFFTCICFDAYSEKSCALLWQEQIYSSMLSYTAQNCVFASYAAKGTLNRCLKEHEFHLIARPGYMGKRNCTYAVRKA